MCQRICIGLVAVVTALTACHDQAKPPANKGALWGRLESPASYSGETGAALVAVGRVWANGITEPAGQGAGVSAEAGIGSPSTDPSLWSFRAATYAGDAADGRDEYTAKLQLPRTPGAYAIAYRFRQGSGAWTYADLDGSDNGFAMASAGKLTVKPAVVADVDYCKLQWPEVMTGPPAATSAPVFGRVYDVGVTDKPTPGSMEAEVGWGPRDSTPSETWHWTSAAFATNIDELERKEDEFSATFTLPSVEGTYDYAYRFRLGPTSRWLLCDRNGSSDGYAAGYAGKLTVAIPYIDWGALRPISLTGEAGKSPGAADVEVYEPGVTDAVGVGPGMSVEVGFGPEGSDPAQNAAAWTFGAASYVADVGPEGANDLYRYTLPATLAVGSYIVAARASMDGGAHFTYLDADDATSIFDPAKAGHLVIAPAMVDWCRLLGSGTVAVAPGQVTPTLEVAVYDAGTTDGGDPAALAAQVGYGPVGTMPDDTWTWGSAGTFARHDGNNDVFGTTLSAPVSAAVYDYTFRLKLATGSPWRFCDLRDLAKDGYDAGAAGRLEVGVPKIDWGTLRPAALAGNDGVSAGQVEIEFYEPGVTDALGGGVGPVVELGVGDRNTDPTKNPASWTFAAATYVRDSGNNDVYALAIPSKAVGHYSYAARVRLDAEHWVWLDTDAVVAFDANVMGQLEVNLLGVDWCILEGPATAELNPGFAGPTVTAKVYEPGVTDATGAPTGLVVELGYGPTETDPATWTSYSAATYAQDVLNDDEFSAVLTAPVGAGNYDYAVRAKLAAGGAYLYCDLTGASDGYSSADAGHLSVVSPLLDWGTVRPAALVGAGGVSAGDIDVEVYEKDVTAPLGQGAGVSVEVGIGPLGSDPSQVAAGWTFTAAAYVSDSGNNDVYRFAVPASLANGIYAYVARAKVGAGEWAWLDTDTDLAFDPRKAGQLSIATLVVGWGQLSVLGVSAKLGPGYGIPAVIEVWADGVTPGAGAGAGLVVEVGIGARGSDPASDASWHYVAATYARDTDGYGVLANDEFEVSVTAPAAPGDYDLAARARLGGGAWLYLDRNGSTDGYTSTEAYGFAVAPLSSGALGWCDTHWVDPSSPPISSVVLTPGTRSPILYGQVWADGVTGSAGAGPTPLGEVGWAYAGHNPVTDGAAWHWRATAYNGAALGNSNNDEHLGTLWAPTSAEWTAAASATLSWAFRFSLDGGVTWLYCDADNGNDSNASFDPTKLGTFYHP